MFNVNSMLDSIASKSVGNIIWKLFTLPAHFLRLIKSEDASLAVRALDQHLRVKDNYKIRENALLLHRKAFLSSI